MQGKIKKEYELLNIDFKNVIVLRLLGGNEFIYVPFDKKFNPKNVKINDIVFLSANLIDEYFVDI